MPRCARVKNVNGVYHIYSRCSSDISLFKDDEDKKIFLNIVKKYYQIYRFKIYAYCLMTTHYHFIIYDNGSDISKFMQCINQTYAQYYNRKYLRHGHVFSDRFKSKVVKDSHKYLLVLSAYIHSNPKDILGYNKKLENYKYSSFSIYLNGKDRYGLVDYSFILSQFNKDLSKARKAYLKFVYNCYNCTPPEHIDIEFNNEKALYLSNKNKIIRNVIPSKVIRFVNDVMGSNYRTNIKFNHDNCSYRSICVVLLKSICGCSNKDICNIFGNITSSNVSRLCNKGLTVMNEKYENIIDRFIEYSNA